MNKRILCVDDNLNILQGFKRGLRDEFDVTIALSGAEALGMIAKNEKPFAVILSDMTMPDMNGAEFLSEAKKVSPDSVRLMLTGNSDQETAMTAVNEGNIFRFLTKPCPIETLTKALDAGIKQYELITAEKELLEGTLNKSIQVLVDVLALVNLTAFSRSNRVKRLTREVAKEMGVSNLWEMEIAAMLSQIGCITVPEEILMKTSKGEPLDDEELVLYQRHPLVAQELISQIPRLEKVASIVAHQDKRFGNKETQLESNQVDTDIFGGQILKAVLDFDKLLELDTLPSAVFEELLSRKGWYDPSILDALKKTVDRRIEEFRLNQVDISDLKAGMLLDKPIFSQNGSLLLSEGQEITLSLILKLNSFAKAKLISNQIQVRIPVVSNE